MLFGLPLVYKNLLRLVLSAGELLEQNDVMKGPAVTRLNGSPLARSLNKTPINNIYQNTSTTHSCPSLVPTHLNKM